MSQNKANIKKFLAFACGLSMAQLVGCTSPEEEARLHLQKGKEYYESGDYKKALLELKTSNQSNDKLAETYYYMGLLDEKNNNLKSMRQNLIRGLDLDPNMVSAKLKLGKLDVLSGDNDKALNHAEEILAADMGNIDAKLLKAAVYVKQAKKDQAKELVQSVLKGSPGNVEALSIQAALQYDNGEIDQALATVKKALESDNKNLPLRLFKIKLDSGRNDIESVTNGYKELTELYPDANNFKLSLASIYSMSDKLDAAEAVLRGMIEKDKDRSEPEIVLIEFLNARAKDRVVDEFYGILNRHQQQAGVILEISKWMAASGYIEPAKKGFQTVIDLEKDSELGLAAQAANVEIALNSKQFDVAKKSLDYILSVNSELMRANLLKVRLLLAENKIDESIEFLNKLSWSKNNADDVYFLLGQAYLAKKDRKQADRNFKQALESNPANLGAFIQLYGDALKAGQRDVARQYLEKALDVKPNQVLLLTNKAELDILDKRWDDARETVQRVALFSKEKAVPIYLQANILQGTGKYTEAIALYDKLLQQFPSHLNSMINLVRSFEAIKQRDKAVAYLESHHEKHPDDLNVIGVLSDIYISSQDFAKTKKLLSEQIKQTPKAVSLYLALAKVESLTGRDSGGEAVKSVYAHGLEVNPDDPQLLMALAGYYESLADRKSARGVYEKLLAKHPDNDLAANNLGFLLIESSDTSDIVKGVDLVKKFKDSDVSYFQDTYAWGLVKSGNNGEGLKLLESLISKEPKVPEFRYHLGVAHYSNGNAATAISELKQALALSEKLKRSFSGEAEAKKILQQLTPSKVTNP